MLGIPRIARRAVCEGLCGGGEPELWRVGLAEQDEPGVAELSREVGVLGGDESELLHERHAAVQRIARAGGDQVLQEKGHAPKRSGNELRRGLCPRALEERDDHGVEFGVDLLDASDGGLDELESRDVARTHELGLGGGIEIGEVDRHDESSRPKR